jgi:cytidylate kinase
MAFHVIAVDGPAGSGKSTTARLVAERLGFLYLDTGAMYRCITLKALRLGVAPSDGNALLRLAQESRIEFHIEDGIQLTILDGIDVSSEIRSPEVTLAVSEVSAHASVRAVLVERQKEYSRSASLVAEGRDTTSVVFPDAFLKVYLCADVQERAKRRVHDLERLGKRTTLQEQIVDLTRRDRYDSSRSASPLTQTDDSVLIDTTGLTIAAQVDRVVDLYRQRRGA